MAKSNKPKVTTPKVGVVTIPVSFNVFVLLKEGKINSILTKEPLTHLPNKIEVICTAISEAIPFEVESMMNVFHGYRPEGYPQDEASRGKSLCLTLTQTINDTPFSPGEGAGDEAKITSQRT